MGKFRADINEEQLLQNLYLTQLKVRESFRDDFDIPEATEAVMSLVQMLEKGFQETETYSASAFVAVSSLRDYIRSYFNLLGIQLGENASATGDDRLRDVLDTSVKFRADVRTAALASASPDKEKLLSLCDGFRDDLKREGIVVHDKAKDRCTWSFEK